MYDKKNTKYERVKTSPEGLPLITTSTLIDEAINEQLKKMKIIQ
jgi:hypothetical protein